MPWYFYGFICSLSVALVVILEKKILLKEHALEFSACSFFF